ncbi:phosphonate ABC transporter ATP-binding protein [Deinococcus sp. QL22]|uniref:phosphonate ABC transporter ATP-binding protein n=1 Tax=Deinococcus sp. QL22 TaxID=2939437 RepID=UPI002016D5C6|nr:phosphonate ABC transporter ATP-binding protein [Deinococcus sp. QL22]UQN08241.1 phosphonate ABC transporter ATP-binding protein [Deinococcus sp. QL22]
MLKITNLVKSYGAAEPVLKQLNLTVDQSGVTSIIGSSGAGKSTLLRCINRLIEPTSGSIELNGTDLVRLRGSELRQARRQIGMVFQSFNLVDRLSVMENVLSGRLGYVSFYQALSRRFPQDDIDRAYHLLERVGLENFVNKRADALSGGQRQRVGVVRALMQNPKILLADEPTASLDPVTSEQIMRLFQELAEELTLPVLINIHNVEQAKLYSQRIVGLRHGRIMFDGLPQDLDDRQLERIYQGLLPAGQETTLEKAGSARPAGM